MCTYLYQTCSLIIWLGGLYDCIGSLAEKPNESKSNQHILGAYVHIHTNYKVSITIYVGRRAN